MTKQEELIKLIVTFQFEMLLGQLGRDGSRKVGEGLIMYAMTYLLCRPPLLFYCGQRQRQR